MFYTLSVTIPKNGLKSFLEFLQKIESEISTKNIQENEMLTSKLAPDMFDFELQIKRVIEQALEISESFSGKKANITMEHNKNYSLAEYKNFISKTIDFLENISENDINSPENTEVRFFWLPGKKIVGTDYLLHWAIPNFYFHITTAYDIARNKGLEIGKADFLGSNFVKSLRDDN